MFILNVNTSALARFGTGLSLSLADIHQVVQLVAAGASCSTHNVGTIHQPALPPAMANTPSGTTKCCH